MEKNYDEMNVEELKDECRQRDIVGFSNLNKDELIQALQDDDNNDLPSEDDEDEGSGERGSRNPPAGKMPEVGAEGGVTKAGTGDFAPGTNAEDPKTAGEGEVVVQDKRGNDVVAEVGADGKSPVSPQNPPKKALIGGGNEVGK